MNISQGDLKAWEIPLPPLDDLTQSIFIDMFGTRSDVSSRALGGVASFFGGSSLPAGTPFSGQESGFLLMKVSDMNTTGNEELIESCSLWSASPGPRASTCPAGTVILPKRGASIATNKKRLATRPTSLDPNLMGVAPDAGSLHSTYLFHWFKRFDLTGITSGSAVPQLNKQDLAPLPLPVPSIQRQTEFAACVGAVADNVSSARGALGALDQLFASLQYCAFSGQL